MFYVHRYLRLTPLLAVLILLSTTLFRFIGDGPIWPGFVEFLRNQCDEHWWSAMLYVQNYVNPDDIVSSRTQNVFFQSGPSIQ